MVKGVNLLPLFLSDEDRKFPAKKEFLLEMRGTHPTPCWNFSVTGVFDPEPWFALQVPLFCPSPICLDMFTCSGQLNVKHSCK